MRYEFIQRKGWLRQRDGWVEAIGLWCSLWVSETLISATAMPILANAVAVVFLLLAPAGKSAPERGGWAIFGHRVPVFACVAAAVSATVYFWSHPPLSFYSFIPIWTGLMAAWYARAALGTIGMRAGRWLAGSEHRAAQRFQHERRPDRFLGYAFLLGVLFLLGSRFLPGGWAGSGSGLKFDRGHLVLCAYACGSLVAYYLAGRRPLGYAENLRWILLGAAWIFLMHPFMQIMLHGTPDATWYGTMMADMLAQVRAGVFPVFAGQSEYQFNGSIYPIRVAPAFLYLGALVDALTLRSLGVFAVQNLLLSLVALGAIVISYLAIAAVIPRHRWCACALAFLYVGCPGVIGLVFNTDLYMSWMTIPALPLVSYGVVRSFRENDLAAMLIVGGSLGILWWGHTPIAMWATLLAAAAQVFRLVVHGREGRGWARMAAGAAAFLLIAAYPIVSVVLYPPGGGGKFSNFQAAAATTVVHFLGAVFPAVLMPLSSTGRQLSDFQLGFALWILLGFCLWNLRRLKIPEFRVLTASAAAIVLLLTPVPWLALHLWAAVPGLLRNTTGNWVMNRLYAVLAPVIVFAAAIAIGRTLDEGGKSRRRVLGVTLALLCAWCASEAMKFSRGSASRQRTSRSSFEQLYTENVMITRFAYLVFPAMPAYFTHGVADPRLENRIFSRPGGEELDSNAGAIARASARQDPMARRVLETDFVVDQVSFNGGALVAAKPVVLHPGRRYLAEFTFAQPGKAPGVLQLHGNGFFREYGLPEYGESESFGSGGAHSGSLPLWTSGTEDADLAVHFFPAEATSNAATLLPFAHLSLIEYDPALLPVKVESWIPYIAGVTSAHEGWLETPRMFQTGYRAWVDGRPAEVRDSGEGLAMVAIPRGVSQVRLEFVAPVLLRVAFYVSLLSAAGWALWMACAALPAPGRP